MEEVHDEDDQDVKAEGGHRAAEEVDPSTTQQHVLMEMGEEHDSDADGAGERSGGPGERSGASLGAVANAVVDLANAVANVLMDLEHGHRFTPTQQHVLMEMGGEEQDGADASDHHGERRGGGVCGCGQEAPRALVDARAV